jgi:Pyridoxamine 5'-phosphate oxidase
VKGLRVDVAERREVDEVPPAGAAAPTLPQDVQAELSGPRLFVLATASPDGVPATTLVSWICALGPSRLAIALDRRGLAYKNALENPAAALEVTLASFSATLRGRMALARPQLASAPFPCAGFEFEVEEIRDHGAPASLVRPACYEYAASKGRYAEREAEIIAELRALSERQLAHAHER